jgi:hypothetical protein
MCDPPARKVVDKGYLIPAEYCGWLKIDELRMIWANEDSDSFIKVSPIIIRGA